MAQTIQAFSLWLMLACGVTMCVLEARAKRRLSSVAWASFAASAVFQQVTLPGSWYVAAAFSFAFPVLIFVDMWRRRQDIRDSWRSNMY